jgi:hypothetical protein
LKECLFVYFIHHGVGSVNNLVASGRYDVRRAHAYYSFRLRRICEMAARTPGAVLVEQSRCGEALGLVESYLGLKPPLAVPEFPPDAADVPLAWRKKADACYERHLYFLKSLPLMRV